MNKHQICQLIISLLVGFIYGRYCYEIPWDMVNFNFETGLVLFILYAYNFKKEHQKLYKIAFWCFLLFLIIFTHSISFIFWTCVLYFMRFRVDYRKISIFLLLIAYIFGIFFSAPEFDFNIYQAINLVDIGFERTHFVLDTAYSIFEKRIIPYLIGLFISEFLYFDVFKNPVPEKLGKFLDNNTLRAIAYFTVLYYILWNRVQLIYYDYIWNLYGGD